MNFEKLSLSSARPGTAVWVSDSTAKRQYRDFAGTVVATEVRGEFTLVTLETSELSEVTEQYETGSLVIVIDSETFEAVFAIELWVEVSPEVAAEIFEWEL
jgi:hypothetical protein